MPVRGPRKRRRIRNLAAERRQKRKERTRGNSGSRRNLAAACRKVSRRAKVAWRKRKLVRRIGTHENCGPRKEFSPAGIRMTHSAKVARGKEHVLQGRKDNSPPRTPTGRTSRLRSWIGPECNNGIRDRGLKQKLEGRTRIKDLGGRLLLCPRNEKTSSWTYRKTIDSVKIANQNTGTYAVSTPYET
jgi:hypothetical protein